MYEVILGEPLLPDIEEKELLYLEKEIYRKFSKCKQIIDKIGKSEITSKEMKEYCTWKDEIIKYVSGKMAQSEILLEKQEKL